MTGVDFSAELEEDDEEEEEEEEDDDPESLDAAFPLSEDFSLACPLSPESFPPSFPLSLPPSLPPSFGPSLPSLDPLPFPDSF